MSSSSDEEDVSLESSSSSSSSASSLMLPADFGMGLDRVFFSFKFCIFAFLAGLLTVVAPFLG
jgi:hypothetical protein